MMPMSSVVNVTVQVTPGSPQSTLGLGVLCIFGTSPNLPIGNRLRFYSSLTAVAADYTSTSPEYLAAQKYLGQNPAPLQVAIARRFATAVPGELLGSVTVDSVVADYAAIATGSLSLTIDGTVENATGINLTGVATLNAVATAVQTALAALKPGTTCTWTGTQFIICSGTTGVTSSVGYSTAAGSGTDLGTMMGLTAALLGVTTTGVAAEQIADTLNAVQALNPAWYGMTFTSEVTDAQIEAAAAWALTQTKLHWYTSGESNIQAAGVTTDLASILMASNSWRTVGQYDPTGQYDIESIAACLFTTDFTQKNAAKNLMFKTEPGVTPVNITATQQSALTTKNINYYTNVGTVAMFMPGITAGGRWVDEVYALDSLQNDIQLAVLGYLANLPTKVPQTDNGMASIVQVITTVMEKYVNAGFLAPGIWNGQPLGAITSGQRLASGFYVYAAPMSSQLAAARTARQAPPITIAACGAGAIQSMNINVVFQQ